MARLHFQRFSAAAAPLLALLLWGPPGAADTQWPGWRGPQGDGQSRETKLPSQWDASSVVWKTPLEGWGQSSPVIWGERIFLTTALDGGRQRVVLCVDRNDGRKLWEHVAWTGQPEPSHKMNGWASATCATDGQVVVAFFGRGGLHAYALDGRHLWSRELGKFESPWGTAACPVIVDNMVIQNCDADADAYLIAVDKHSGETIWKTPRPDRRGWSTPLLTTGGGRPELVLNGHEGVTGYDPATGRQLWFCKSFNGRGEPTVTPAGGLLVAVNGLKGDIYAVRPGGDGDVTATHMAWHTPRAAGRDMPSPIVVGNYVTVMSMSGICVSYDGRDGRQLWQERIGGSFSASPIAAGDLVYFISEDGQTVVIRPGPKPEIVARNELGDSGSEIFRASLTPSEGQIFARSDRMLYCIGQRQAPAAE